MQQHLCNHQPSYEKATSHGRRKGEIGNDNHNMFPPVGAPHKGRERKSDASSVVYIFVLAYKLNLAFTRHSVQNVGKDKHASRPVCGRDAHIVLALFTIKQDYVAQLSQALSGRFPVLAMRREMFILRGLPGVDKKDHSPCKSQ
eukprot:3486113-Amphidinium_carterae.1